MGKLATPQPNKKLYVSLVHTPVRAHTHTPTDPCGLDLPMFRHASPSAHYMMLPCKLIIRRSFLKSSSPPCEGFDRSGMVQWVKV